MRRSLRDAPVSSAPTQARTSSIRGFPTRRIARASSADNCLKDVPEDVRRKFIQERRSAEELPARPDLDWKDFLRRACEAALLAHREDSLVIAAEDLGVALAAEVEAKAADLSSTVGLKILEQERFLKAVASISGAARQRPQSKSQGKFSNSNASPANANDDDDQDVSGFGGDIG